MEEIIDQEHGQTGKRPVLLSVLCILSFIWSSIWAILILGIIWFLGADSASGSAFVAIVIALTLVILNIVGVAKMWNLKRSGFYIYVVTSVIVTSLTIYSNGEVTLYGVLIPLIFIALFALNWKHLK